MVDDNAETQKKTAEPPPLEPPSTFSSAPKTNAAEAIASVEKTNALWSAAAAMFACA